jgi:hypothetical protein
MFGVMLLNIPKDCSDFLRAAFKLILRFGEFVLRLGFQRGDLVSDCNGVEIGEIVHRRVPLFLGSARIRRAALSRNLLHNHISPALP